MNTLITIDIVMAFLSAIGMLLTLNPLSALERKEGITAEKIFIGMFMVSLIAFPILVLSKQYL